MQTSGVFRQKIRDSLARAVEEQTILFFMLSDWVYALLIPRSYHYSEHETKQIAKEIKQNILPEKHQDELYSILTWQEVVHQNQHLCNAFDGWQNVRELQPVFFVNDEVFHIASESLWKGDEIEVTQNRYIEKRIAETKNHEKLKEMLPAEAQIRAAQESLMYSGLSLEAWAKPLQKSDWLNLGKPVQISLRSPQFSKAWPDALTRPDTNYLWSIQCEDVASGCFEHVQGKGADLFEHYYREAKRTLGKRSYDCQVYLHEDPEQFGAVLVGDQIASIAAFPELVSGSVSPFGLEIPRVRIQSRSEDSIIIFDPKLEADVLKSLEQKESILLRDQHPDGVDALFYNELCILSEYPCGHFSWREIPGPYFDLVEAALEAKTSLPPGRAEYLRGLAYEIIQSWGKAVEVFRTAFKYNFSDGDINHALGRALVECGSYQEAIGFLEKASILLPEDPDVANGLGIALLECGQQDTSAHALEKAVSLAPDDAQFLSNLGRCYFSGKRFSEAEYVLRRALEFSPNFSEAHAMLAQLKWRTGDVGTARKHARKAFASNPGSKYTQDLLWALTVDEH